MKDFKNLILNEITTFGGGFSTLLGGTYALAVGSSPSICIMLWSSSAILLAAGVTLNDKEETKNIPEPEWKFIEEEKIKLGELHKKLLSLNNRQDIYFDFSETIQMIRNVSTLERTIGIDSTDFILFKRMVEKYLPELIDNYNLLTKEDQELESKKIIETLHVMQGKLQEIINKSSSEASRNISKISSMSNEILKNNTIVKKNSANDDGSLQLSYQAQIEEKLKDEFYDYKSRLSIKNQEDIKTNRRSYPEMKKLEEKLSTKGRIMKEKIEKTRKLENFSTYKEK